MEHEGWSTCFVVEERWNKRGGAYILGWRKLSSRGGGGLFQGGAFDAPGGGGGMPLVDIFTTYSIFVRNISTT